MIERQSYIKNGTHARFVGKRCYLCRTMEEDFDIRRSSNSSAEREFENALRPLQFGDFSGQLKVVENLKVFVEAAKYRGEPLDHTLLHGHVRPGIGQAGRFGRYPDFVGAERRALHRRNPPAQSRSGGVSLFRHGGLPDRHHDRQRPVGTQYTARLESLYFGGCHYAQRSAYRSPPCPFRYQPASGVL